MEVITDERAAIDRRINEHVNYEFGQLDEATKINGLNHIFSLRDRMAKYRQRQEKKARRNKILMRAAV